MVHPVGGSCSIWSGIVGSKNVRMFCCDSEVNVVCGYLYLGNNSDVRGIGFRLFHNNVSSLPVLCCLFVLFSFCVSDCPFHVGISCFAKVKCLRCQSCFARLNLFYFQCFRFPLSSTRRSSVLYESHVSSFHFLFCFEFSRSITVWTVLFVFSLPFFL